MSDDPAADIQASRVIERAQAQIEAAAREASRWDAKWDGYCGLVQACEEDEGWGEFLTEVRRRRKQAGRENGEEDEEEEEDAFSPERLSALRERLEALRCAAVSAAVVPARSVVAVGENEREEQNQPTAAAAKAAKAAAEASDAAYSAAVGRVRAGDMRGAAALLRDAAFVEERPRARARIAKYLSAVEARATSSSKEKSLK